MSQNDSMSRAVVRLLLPIGLMLVASIPFAVSNADVRISSMFFDANTGDWPLKDLLVVRFMYSYGTWLTWIAVDASLFIIVVSSITPRGRRLRRLAVFFVLAVIIGPGLLVNALGKGELHRPRPRQIVEFGGEQPFQRLGIFAIGGTGASFPSGHASMGFVWLAPAYYLRGRNPRASRWFVVLAMVHGSALGLARIVVGAHFFSDVLWSAGANCIAATVLCVAFGLVARANDRPDDFQLDVMGTPPAAPESQPSDE